MKYEVKKFEDFVEETKYPYLGIDGSGQIVFFTSENTGTMIAGHLAPQWQGYYIDQWIESSFKKFNGSVTLSND